MSENVGDRFAQWLIIGIATNRNGRRCRVVRCTCGTVREVLVQSLRSGASKSCGCTAIDRGRITFAQTIAERPRVYCNNDPYERLYIGGNVRVSAHRQIAATALGKPLPETAVVHHVDENKRNNVNSNLVICQDEAYHQLLHLRARIVRARGNPNTDHICGDCGVKPLADFYKYRSGRYAGTPISTCKGCTAIRNAAARQRRANSGKELAAHA